MAPDSGFGGYGAVGHTGGLTLYQELQHVRAQLTGPGGPFEICEVEVGGRQLKAYKNAPTDLRAAWSASSVHGAADYLVYQGERYSFADAHDIVAAVAANLVSTHGVQPGDRVAVAMRNYPEWLLAYWAVVSVGAAVVGMNAWWTGPEMVYALNDSTPKLLIGDAERLTRLAPHTDEVGPLTTVLVRGDDDGPTADLTWDELSSGDGSMPEVVIDPDADASIFYTSGTTGRPKGAQLTHRGCTNNIMSLAYWGTAAGAAAAMARGEEFVAGRETDAEPAQMASLVCTPLFHVTANNCVSHGATLAGGKLVLMYKWDPLEALKLIETERITNMSGVPVMSRELISPSPVQRVRHIHAPADGWRRRSPSTRSGGQDRGQHRAGSGRDGLRHDRNVWRHHDELGGLLRGQAGYRGAAPAELRRQDRRRGGQRVPSRRPRRAVCSWRPGDQGVSEQARGHSRGDRRRVVAHRRHRAVGRRRLRADRRPGQGHAVARRRERVLRRGGSGHLLAPGGSGVCGLRCAGRSPGRGSRCCRGGGRLVPR